MAPRKHDIECLRRTVPASVEVVQLERYTRVLLQQLRVGAAESAKHLLQAANLGRLRPARACRGALTERSVVTLEHGIADVGVAGQERQCRWRLARHAAAAAALQHHRRVGRRCERRTVVLY